MIAGASVAFRENNHIGLLFINEAYAKHFVKKTH